MRGALAHWDMSLKEAFDCLPKTTSKGDNFGFGAKVGVGGERGKLLADTSYAIVIQPDERRSSTVFSSTSPRCTTPEAVGRWIGEDPVGVGPRALYRAHPRWD